jgi:integrase
MARFAPGRGCYFRNWPQWTKNTGDSLFQMTCRRLGTKGISLHSYRYAWAERAKVAGMPERFAQEAMGHNSKAVHRAYAKKAQMKIPSLEEYEQRVV